MQLKISLLLITIALTRDIYCAIVDDGFWLEECKNGVESAQKLLKIVAHRIVMNELFQKTVRIAHLTFGGKTFNGCSPTSLSSQRNSQNVGEFSLNEVSNETIDIPSLFEIRADKDPYVHWMKELWSYLRDALPICNGNKFMDINSITREQLWGFLSLLVVNNGNVLCPICDNMISAIKRAILRRMPSSKTTKENTVYMLMLAHIPETETICSTLIPYCHLNYTSKAENRTAAYTCARCTICMTATTILESRVLLNKKRMNTVYAWLNNYFVRRICESICVLSSPDGGSEVMMSYDECFKFSYEIFTELINRMVPELMPTKFCSSTLDWCQDGITPSIIYCLKEFCDELLPVQLGTTICRMIPDGSDEARKYLNIDGMNVAQFTPSNLKPQNP